MATSCLQGETGQLGPDSGFGFCARAGRELALGNGPPGTGEEHWVRCSTEPFKNRSLQVERIGPGSSQALPNPRAACPSGAKGPYAELPTAARLAPPFQPGRRAVFSPQRFRSCGGDTSAMDAYAEGMCELCAAALQRARRLPPRPHAKDSRAHLFGYAGAPFICLGERLLPAVLAVLARSSSTLARRPRQLLTASSRQPSRTRGHAGATSVRVRAGLAPAVLPHERVAAQSSGMVH
jgi:hypothetical protein